jgi:amino acid permease
VALAYISFRFHGLNAWEKPFASNYQGIEGHAGRLLGFWAVMMQAAFSFSGSEVPGIAAGEFSHYLTTGPNSHALFHQGKSSMRRL